MTNSIIIANGRTPGKGIVNYFFRQGFTRVICADGGANSARRINVLPDLIIGDLDSISKENLEYFSDKSEIIRMKGQDDTDVEKCLKFLIKRKCKACALLGVIGDRLDHSFGNLAIAKRYSDFIDICVAAEKSFLTIHKGKTEFATVPGEMVSLYGFDSKTKITSEGLKYKIWNEAIQFTLKESTSNQATSDIVKLNIKGGKIFVIRELKTIIKLSRKTMFAIEIN
ncbi:MAG: thiamine diphosphokinase [Ignavibacteria bacterium]